MPDQDALSKLDRAYDAHVRRESWQQAAQNRMQVAAMAYTRGRSDLFHAYSQQAIDLAQRNSLRRLELGLRITRFQYMLQLDRTGQILDELRQEVDCALKPSGELIGVELTGELSRRLESYCGGALASYTQVLQTFEKWAADASYIPELEEAIEAAERQATAFALVYRAGKFEDGLGRLRAGSSAAELSAQLRSTVEDVQNETAKIYISLRTDLLLLAAQFKSQLKSPEIPPYILAEAERLSQPVPEKRCQVHMAWADLAESQGDLPTATEHARRAVAAAQESTIAGLWKTQAASKLSGLLARQQTEPSPPQVMPEQGATARVYAQLDIAHRALLERRFADALSACDKVLPLATTPQLQRAVLRERAIAFYELGRFGEAEADIDKTIALIATELAADTAVLGGAFDSRITEEENLFLLKAWLRAKSGQKIEAWNAAERGRAGSLKHQIASSIALPHPALDGATFEVLQPWLCSERVAMLAIAATPWGTLALLAGPDDSEPEAMCLEFSHHELRELLARDDSPDSQNWTATIFDAVPKLSARILHPLGERLLKIARGARVLYIIPDSFLYYAPFAALTVDEGMPLIEVCPLAIAPSIGFLLWCASRRGVVQGRACLAVGVGKALEVEFHDHLNQVAAAFSPETPRELRDEAATIANFAAEAPHYPVLYISCHGSVSRDVRDVMAASWLELAGQQRLTARDVLSWKLRADLVFLNACQSGRFLMESRTEPNGFVRAWLVAGARSLIAALTHIDPRAAGDLAEVFFREWLGGADAAEALRRAQSALKRRGSDPKDWASHCLVGDYL